MINFIFHSWRQKVGIKIDGKLEIGFYVCPFCCHLQTSQTYFCLCSKNQFQKSSMDGPHYLNLAYSSRVHPTTLEGTTPIQWPFVIIIKNGFNRLEPDQKCQWLTISTIEDPRQPNVDCAHWHHHEDHNIHWRNKILSCIFYENPKFEIPNTYVNVL